MRNFVVNPSITGSMAEVLDTSVLLVEQNSRMALRISRLADTVGRGIGAIHGQSAEPRSDDRVRAGHISGAL